MPNRALLHLSRARLIAYVALAAVAATFLVIQAEQGRMRLRVNTSREIARIGREVGGLALDRESGIRGYRLTRNTAFLEAEVAARGSLTVKFDTLRSYARTDPDHERPIAALAAAMDEWDRAYAEPLLAAVGTRLAPELLPTEVQGKERFDGVRAALEQLLAAEDQHYMRRLDRQQMVAWFGLVALALELTLLGGLFGWHYRRTREQTIQLVDQQTLLEDQALELELQAQEAQETLSLLDMIVEGMPNGLAILDETGRIQRTNAALAAMLTAHPERLVGTEITTALAPHGAAVRETLDAVITGGAPVTNVALEQVRTGSGVGANSWLLSIYPVGGPSGASTYGCIVVDRSEEAQLERQFIQAQKMEAIGRLAGGVAHDFNNILLAIGATCELIAAENDGDDDLKRDLNDVIQTVQRGAGLTQQLLAFTRQQVLRPVVLDLNASIREMEPMLKRLIGADIAIRTRLTDDLRLVEVDPTQIQQIIMNLAVNARDAMPGGGTLVLETGNVDLDEAYAREHPPLAAGPYAMLAVTDSGQGIDPPTLARLFEPFFTTKEQGKGTGLGLSTVYGIVRQSGGYVWAYSEPGHGATFKIYLPQSARSVTAARTVVTTTPSSGGQRPTGRLLVVEDDAAVRTAMHRALLASGYDVVVAENGTEALEIVRKAAPAIDLVVSDVVMPGMGGRALVTELERLPRVPRVLLMSGYTRDAAIQLSMLDAGTRFLEKPFTLEALRQRVREILESGLD